MYANITVTGDGGHTFAAELRAAGTRVQRYGPPVVRSNAKALQERVRAHASGRPGPNIITGDYLKSIKVSSGIEGTSYSSMRGRFSQGFEAEVYSDAPQARRLELGFVGVDSLGRHYDQPPFPHWAPAVAEVNDHFFIEMDRVVNSAFVRGRR